MQGAGGPPRPWDQLVKTQLHICLPWEAPYHKRGKNRIDHHWWRRCRKVRPVRSHLQFRFYMRCQVETRGATTARPSASGWRNSGCKMRLCRMITQVKITSRRVVPGILARWAGFSKCSWLSKRVCIPVSIPLHSSLRTRPSCVAYCFQI